MSTNQVHAIDIIRLFDAPLELVWKAWTEPEMFMKWWGPQHFTSPVCKMDLKVGGKYLFCMRSPEGRNYWTSGEFLEIKTNERLVYTDSFADEHGNMVTAAFYDIPGDFPEVTKVTLTFEDACGKTRMKLRHECIPDGTMSEDTKTGWNQSFDKLAESFSQINMNTQITIKPGIQEIVVTRVFDAPRELVFKVITDRAQIPNWWGPKYLTTIVEKMELKQGGIWRIIQNDPQGNVFAFHGVYHDLLSPKMIVRTFEFEGMPGHVCLESLWLDDINGKTKWIQKSVFQSVEDRDGMVVADMETGVNETMDRLAELLKENQI